MTQRSSAVRGTDKSAIICHADIKYHEYAFNIIQHVSNVFDWYFISRTDVSLYKN